jgi:hypothetical protein
MGQKIPIDKDVDVRGTLNVRRGATLESTLAVTGAVSVDTISEKTAAAGVTIDSVQMLDGALKTTSGAGTAQTGVTAAEHGDGVFHKTVLTINSAVFALTEAGTAGWGTMPLYDFPAGSLSILGVTADITFDASADTTNVAATGSGDFSVGSTATADATLDTTDVDLVPSSPLSDPFVSSVGLGVGRMATMVTFDGTTTPKEAHLNLIIDAGDQTDDAAGLTLTGTVTIAWLNAGDYTALA